MRFFVFHAVHGPLLSQGTLCIYMYIYMLCVYCSISFFFCMLIRKKKRFMLAYINVSSAGLINLTLKRDRLPDNLVTG